MLTAEQLDRIVDNANVRKLMQQAELDIIEDMARRISKMDYATNTSKWQLLKLQQIGAQRQYIFKALSDITGKSQESLFELFDDTATTALKADDAIYKANGIEPTVLAENQQLQQILQSGMQQTQDMFVNLTQQTAVTGAQQFGQVADRAYMQITSGAFSYDTAIKNAVKSLVKDGVVSVTYPSGRKDSIDVATRRALLTSVNQASLKVSLSRAEQLDVNLVEVSAHTGARVDHALWQGGVFSLKGSTPKYRNFYTVTGYGTVKGLGGPGCRHNFSPFFEDSKASYTKTELKEINNVTVTYNGKEIPQDEALQVQRSMERAVRKWKREESAMTGANLDTGQAKSKVREWQGKLREFTDQTGLKRDYIRERV